MNVELLSGDRMRESLSMRRSVTRHVRLLLVTLSCICATCATAQRSSFLSIDCGAKEAYTDGIGIEWVTDEGYISSGRDLSISLTTLPGQEPYLTSRYFPDTRNKHCYVLPAFPDTTYLIRAVILHGESPLLALPVSFDVTVNSNYWFPFSLGVDDSRLLTPITYEAILNNQRDHIDVCVREATEGVAWISSLELRALPNGTYVTAAELNKFMDMTYRYNMGITKSTITRWPDDVLDRIWFPANNVTFPNADRGRNSTALPFIDQFASGYNQPPDAVMIDAFFGPDFTWQWTLLADTEEVYAALYFQDIRNVTATESSPVGLVITVEASVYDMNLTDGRPFEVFYNSPVTGNSINTTIVRQPWYEGDAFLNAIEIYQVTDINSTFASEEDVTALQVLQTSFGLSSWTGDPCYPVPYNWVSCDGNNRISGLYLSDQNITGSIPSEIGDLTNLKEIYLDNNNIFGSIPTSLPLLPSLTVLALDNNSLSGGIPSTLQNKAGFTFSGNPNLTLCQSTDTECTNPNPEPSPGKKSNTGVIVGVAAGISVAVLLVIVFVVVYIRKRRKPKPTPETSKADNEAPASGGAAFYHSGQSPLMNTKPNKSREGIHSFDHSTDWPSEHSEVLRTEEPGPNLLTKGQPSARANVYQVAGFMAMSEVLAATRNHQRKIGEGGYGPVYYGKLANGKDVAVKVNKIGAHQGNDEFVNEVALLTRVHHKNLVSLLAFCEEENERVLIYEYQQNGTLSDLLYGPHAASKPLPWKTRLEIALDAAKGLEYLHTGCNPRIIHRDIKSNNILIDDKMVAKVADFGISKSTPDQQTTNQGQFSTVVRGTPGYLDPEYYMLQKLSHKSDVYSFGVVLMEIISGLHPIRVDTDGSQSSIINLMKQCLQTGDIYGIADPRLNGKFNPESAWKVAEIAWSCVEREGVRRPDMTLVVRGLSEAYEMELSYDPNNPSLDSSFQLSSRRP